MKTNLSSLVCGLLAVISVTSLHAQAVNVYSQAELLNYTSSHYYTEDFQMPDGTSSIASGTDFNSNGYDFKLNQITSQDGNGFYYSTSPSISLTTYNTYDGMVFDLSGNSGGGVNAFGGNFFLTDQNTDGTDGDLSITYLLSDGTQHTDTLHSTSSSYDALYSNEPYWGIVLSGSDVITTVTISSTDSNSADNQYATVANVTVGTASVPEPTSWALIVLGVAMLVGVARVRRASLPFFC